MAALTSLNASQHSTKRGVVDKTSLTSPPRKRPRPANTISPSKDADKPVQQPYAVPILEAAGDGSFSWRKFLHDYSAHKVVLLRSFQDTHGFGLRDVSDIFERSASAKKTWCTENKFRGRVETNRLDPSNQRAGDSWYASFILQEDPKLLGKVVHSLPLSELTQQHSRFAKSTNEKKSTWVHTSSVWFFVGSNTNPDATPMKGRKEHTDAISHDGTW